MIHITAYLSFSVYLHIVKCQIKKTKGKWKYKYRGQSVLARSGCSWHTQTPTQASAGFQLRRKLCASRTARERCGGCCWNLVYYYLPYWVNDSYCDFSDSVYPVQEVILWNVLNEWEMCVGVKHTTTDAFFHWLNHTPSDIQASELIIRGEDWWMGSWSEEGLAGGENLVTPWVTQQQVTEQWLGHSVFQQVDRSADNLGWQSFFLSMRSFLLNTAGSIIVVRQEKQSWNFNR